MVIYVTANSRYSIERVGRLHAIKAQKGPWGGMDYGILGAYNPTRHTLTFDGAIAIFDDNRLTIDQLADVLDSEIKIGSKIVGRLLDKQGRFVPVARYDADMIVTTPVRKIIKNKK